MAMANNNTAVECSFMAPGLGPWRPDMVPYVDQRDTSGLIGLGQWGCAVTLQRTTERAVSAAFLALLALLALLSSPHVRSPPRRGGPSARACVRRGKRSRVVRRLRKPIGSSGPVVCAVLWTGLEYVNVGGHRKAR